MNAVATIDPTPQHAVSTWLTPTSFERAQQLADLMQRMGTMPKHLSGKPADCFRIVVQAAKWGMDPYAVAECTSLVHGRLCYEGKLVAAVLRQTNAIEGRLDYVIEGEGQNSKITITGTPTGGTPKTLKGSVEQWRTTHKDDKGNKVPNNWDKDPHSMLAYRATRQWARLYAPEAMLGIVTADEMDEEVKTVEAVVHDDQPGDGLKTGKARRRTVLPDQAQTPAAAKSPATEQPPAASTTTTTAPAATTTTTEAKAPEATKPAAEKPAAEKPAPTTAAGGSTDKSRDEALAAGGRPAPAVTNTAPPKTAAKPFAPSPDPFANDPEPTKPAEPVHAPRTVEECGKLANALFFVPRFQSLVQKVRTGWKITKIAELASVSPEECGRFYDQLMDGAKAIDPTWRMP